MKLNWFAFLQVLDFCERVSCHSYEINILLYFPTSYLCEQAFSLSLKTVTEIILFQLKMRFVYVSLKINSALTIYVAKDKQTFHILFSFKNSTSMHI